MAGAILGILAPYVIKAVTAGGNWRFGWYIIAVCGAISAVVVMLLMKNKPEDVGEVIDGGTGAEKVASVRSYRSTVYKRKLGDYTPFKEAIRRYRFWALAIMAMGGFCVSNLLYSPGSVYFLGEAGMTSDHLAIAQTIQMIVSLVSAMIINRLADRIEPLRLVAGCIAIMAVGALGATKTSVEAPFLW